MATDRADDGRRAELAAFVRSRRQRLAPRDVGLPDGRRRRTPGLRREEVAELAAVGVTWYTWLEQGRDIRMSAQALGGIADALRLDPDETRHLFVLAGQPPPPAPAWGDRLPALGRLVAALDPLPAYATRRNLDLLAWNRAARAVFLDFDRVPPAERNLLRLTFASAELRRRLPDWEDGARRLLGAFRAEWARHPGAPGFAEVIRELQTTDPRFRRWWDEHAVRERREACKVIDHPVAGRLVLEPVDLAVAGSPDLRLVVFVPPDGETATRIRRLTDGDGAAPG
jgi:transcriptional regulator with XRE-family HTH domain